jgi:hypothetical protein
MLLLLRTKHCGPRISRKGWVRCCRYLIEDKETLGCTGTLRKEYAKICGMVKTLARSGNRTNTTTTTLAQQPNAGQGRLIRGVLQITHNDATQSVGLLWTSGWPVAETSTWQHSQTNVHAPGWIRTRNLSKRAAVDPRFRPLGHWDRHYYYYY